MRRDDRKRFCKNGDTIVAQISSALRPTETTLYDKAAPAIHFEAMGRFERHPAGVCSG